MPQPHIQLAQELLEHIIGFLYEAPADLKACALVSSGCVHEAQSHIFKEISIGGPGTTATANDAVWTRLQDTLQTSPHLIRHIRRLETHPRQISSGTFSAICLFPFTHLEEAYTSYFDLFPASAIAIQQLFSLPTLRRVGLGCQFPQPEIFLQIWERCSPSIRHLELRSCRTQPSEFEPTSGHSSTPIRLESAQLTALPGIRDWVHHPLCPFDFSELRELLIFKYTEILSWPTFAPALRTIRVLAFSATAYMPTIDLSLLRSLIVLRIFLYNPAAWPKTMDTLSTIAPSNGIRKIVICGTLAEIPAEELDVALSSLPMHHPQPFEFEMEPIYYDRLSPSLQRLISNNKLRRADTTNSNWFKGLTRSG
ncbi:hypothetical protein DFH09DRAFT_1155741 [Mycena vulgaris]|nr:hypothetical protein DFH09DRAFT_1155741 [Mycena vulgaris]